MQGLGFRAEAAETVAKPLPSGLAAVQAASRVGGSSRSYQHIFSDVVLYCGIDVVCVCEQFLDTYVDI